MVSLDKGSQWVNVKQKSLRQTPSTFRHNQAGIFGIQSKCGKKQTKKISVFGHFSRSVNFWQEHRKMRANEFIFRICSFTKNELFLRVFSKILLKSFRVFLSQGTSLHICCNSKQIVYSLFKIIQSYVNNMTNN